MRTDDGRSSPGSNLGELRSSGAVGSLDLELIDALNSDSHLLAQPVRVLLDSNFGKPSHARP